MLVMAVARGKKQTMARHVGGNVPPRAYLKGWRMCRTTHSTAAAAADGAKNNA